MGAVGVSSYSLLGKKGEIEEETKSLSLVHFRFSSFFSTATAPNACCSSSNVGALLQGGRRGGRRRRLCSCRRRSGLRVRRIPPRRRLCASSGSGGRRQGECGRGQRRRRFCRRCKHRHLRGWCCSSSSRRQASRRRGAGRGEGVILRARESLAKARRGEAPRRERRAILDQSCFILFSNVSLTLFPVSVPLSCSALSPSPSLSSPIRRTTRKRTRREQPSAA